MDIVKQHNFSKCFWTLFLLAIIVLYDYICFAINLVTALVKLISLSD